MNSSEGNERASRTLRVSACGTVSFIHADAHFVVPAPPSVKGAICRSSRRRLFVVEAAQALDDTERFTQSTAFLVPLVDPPSQLIDRWVHTGSALEHIEQLVRIRPEIVGLIAIVGIADNAVDGLVRIVDNSGNATVAGNTINGSLTCLRNDPAPDNAGEPNTVAGPATGQCENL